MELSQLRHFVQTAAMLNYSRAAEALGIGQPALSKSIQNLEKAINVRLFERSKRSVKLTHAGAAFLEEVQGALSKLDMARNIAQRLEGGEVGRIRIGWIATAHHYGVQHFIRKFRSKWKSILLVVEEIPNAEQPEALRSGKIDLGFFSTSGADLDGLAVHVLDRCDYIAAVPSSWPEAKRKQLKLKDLARHPFVCKSPDAAPPHHFNEIMAACCAAGFTPKVAQLTKDTASVRSLVACEIGVALLPKMRTLPKVDGVTYIPLVGAPPYLTLELAMAWVPRGVSTALQALIQVISEDKLCDQRKYDNQIAP